MSPCAFAFLLLVAPQDEFVDMTAADILEWMTAHSERRFSAGSELGLKNRRVTLPKSMLDVKQPYEIGTRLLRGMDLAVVPADGSGLHEVVHATIACKKPLAVFSDPAKLPASDEFCTLSLRLQHVSPRDVQAALFNLCSYPQGCLSSEPSRSIVISDFASNLRKLAEVVKLMDVPGPAGSFRLTMTVLEATQGDPPDVPEAFVPLDLPKAAKAQRFRSLGEVTVLFKVSEVRPGLAKAPPASEGTFRFRGPHPLVVELAGSSRGAVGPAFERFTVSPDREGAAPGAPLLQTRVEIREGAWVLVGVLPTDIAGTSLVVLARAQAE